MAHYNLTLSDNPSFCEICVFSQEYVGFVNRDDSDEAMVLSGAKLKHVEKIIDFIKTHTGVNLNLMACVDVIYRLAENKNSNDESFCRSFLISEVRAFAAPVSQY